MCYLPFTNWSFTSGCSYTLKKNNSVNADIYSQTSSAGKSSLIWLYFNELKKKKKKKNPKKKRTGHILSCICEKGPNVLGNIGEIGEVVITARQTSP